MKWKIPDEDETGTIQEIGSSKVLGLKNNATKKRTDVILETFEGSEYQMWTRSKKTSDGYFTLLNPISGRALSEMKLTSENYLIIDGNLFLVSASADCLI